MKHLIAAVSLSLLAAPAVAQSTFDRTPTDPVMPSYAYDPTVSERAAAQQREHYAAASGATRSDVEIAQPAPVPAYEYEARHLERQPGYFDPR